MNPRIKIIFTAIAAFAAGGLLVFYFVKAGPESTTAANATAAAQLKRGANGETIVTLDAETQQRLALKMEILASAHWQPEVKGYGRVVDPAALAAAVADLESARTMADASVKEYERQKTLAAQNNASARALEAAKAVSIHDETAFEAALAKFKLDWGAALAEDGGKILSEIVNGRTALVRVDLPAGETLPSPPSSARIVALTDEAKSVGGEFFGATDGVNPQTQSRSFFFLVKDRPLALGSAVTGFLKISGEPLSGAIVPADAILRYEGKNWIYVQTGADEFSRREISLDRPAENGWFISGALTNRAVVSSAQTILSAELNTGSSAPKDND